jgi:hypothetical protein
MDETRTMKVGAVAELEGLRAKLHRLVEALRRGPGRLGRVGRRS